MNNLDPKGEFNFILQELKATNQNNKLKKMRENQKAIECLEEAKREFETYYADNIWNYPEWIDQKISELKGE